MTFVKICGITNLADALLCVEAGADALGFNFYPQSPRYVTPAKAREIIDHLPPETLNVGVFANEESPSMVEHIAIEAGVAAVQLHGDESPEFCLALSDRFVIKVFRPTAQFKPESITDYKVKAVMIDSFDRKLLGGTGRTSDWSLARQLRELAPRLFLAGGLSPENVAEAVRFVSPYAVDACSALEVTPGKKDPLRVQSFVKAVHLAVKR